MGVARAWLTSGGYFHPDQLAGPYTWVWGDVVYPPVALWLFVPFSFLPPALWFAIPAAVIAAALWRLRPALWAWALMAVLLIEPVALVEVCSGNPLIWYLAIGFAAAAGWLPGSLALFKPSLLWFTGVGIRRRSWWLGVALLALFSLPFLPLTLTWVRVILDTRGRGGLFYSVDEFAYALMPIVAWLSSRTRNSSWSQLLQERKTAATSSHVGR